MEIYHLDSQAALTCRHWQLGINLVHKDLSSGFHRDDLEAIPESTGVSKGLKQCISNCLLVAHTGCEVCLLGL